MPIYSSLYQNFIRQGSALAKSITTHGYAHRVGRLASLQLNSAFHTERSSAGPSADSRPANSHGGLDAYFEALQKKQATGDEAENDVDDEWTQFEFPKRIEWKPNAASVLTGDEAHAAAVAAEDVVEASDATGNATKIHGILDPDDVDHIISLSPKEQVVLDHIDAALEKEIESRRLQEAIENVASTVQRPVPESAISSLNLQSQSYADHLQKLSSASRYAEIPALFEAMLASGVAPISAAYNALLHAAIHLPMNRIEVVSKALDVYADMLRRRVLPDADTYEILVNLLASRSLEVSGMKKVLEEKRTRFGGMDEPGKFMFASNELEHAILCEDDRLGLAMQLFGTSIDADAALYSADTYRQLIMACAQSGRVSDMVRLYEHMELREIVPFASIFPAMITAFAKSGDLVSAVECYTEYRTLAVAQGAGSTALLDRLDAEVYASVIDAYVVSDKAEGASKFFHKIVDEYGAKVAGIKDALVTSGFVKGFLTLGKMDEALHWAQSVEGSARSRALSLISTLAADKNDAASATKAYTQLPMDLRCLAEPSMALLAMSIRRGDVASAAKYWAVLSSPEMVVTPSLIEPTTMFAVALIGSGQVAEGLAQSEAMFQRILAAAGSDARPQLVEEIDEGLDFISRYMSARGIVDPRELSSQVSSLPSRSRNGSPSTSTPTASSFEDTFDPYSHTTDYKGSSLIADDLEANLGHKGPRLNDALNRFRNIRRAGRHPRYITYAKLISAAARESKMDLCREILAMARRDVPLLNQYAVVRYGWLSILDAMVGACLTSGSRGQAEQYHQELLQMGAAPSANTFGLYITTMKDSTKTFDEATEAVRIFHRAQMEGVEPSSFLYNALIGKLGKARRIDDCLFYFAEMRALGIKPTSVTYGTIVNALCRVSDDKFAEELFDEMEAMPNYKARPAPYNSMMQFFLTTKRDKSKVLAYYDRMVARGIVPTSHTYKLLIDTHATLETVDMDAAEKVLETMRAAGQQPDSVHYASLIHARGCVLHDMDGAREIFDKVTREAAVPVNASIYQALFESMVANHRVVETEPILGEMQRGRVELTPYIANTLIHGWAAEKNIDKAQAIYDAVSRDKREPSTYEAMTRAFLAVEQREQAKGAVGEMLTRGYPSAVVNRVLELLGGGQELAAE
ncbi:Pentatricopeptide repeat-containing protein 5 [Escovopsis weberi]|uniref:Pentatricopeptide repeat-containing protein 5 n=1 Tax=Escovopsis weberi TaxID=150374 RepID=A0A0M8MT92_ESCWE|nr:Pentatricopeptide repeat-containing protein 5 [Escovopsis weberi]